MFDTPENRFRYEVARSRHDKLMAEDSREGKSYRAGFNGWTRHVGDDYEHWRAGKDNAKEIKSMEGE